MSNSLEHARRRARALRYRGEGDDTRVTSGGLGASMIARQLAQSGLEVSASLTPRIEAGLQQACSALELKRSLVQAFIVPSAEAQAYCYHIERDSCVLVVTSQMVNLLTGADEIAFVVGHELGHFLLEHRAPSPGLAGLRIQRAREVSADRVGLIAASNLTAALRTVVKTLSGLGDAELRYDIARFLDTALAESDDVDQSGATHPSLPMRARCLVQFDTYMRKHASVEQLISNPQTLQALDQLIDADVCKFIEGPIIRRIEKARRRLVQWAWIRAVIEQGELSLARREAFEQQFGADTLRRILELIEGCTRLEAQQLITTRLESASADLESWSPGETERVLRDFTTKASAGERDLQFGSSS